MASSSTSTKRKQPDSQRPSAKARAASTTAPECTTTQAPAPNWLELPRDVTAKILLKLGAIEILTSAQRVCSLWRNICKDPLMWRTIDMRNLGTSYKSLYKLEVMCRHAIDRSCGQLVDINVESFCTDSLLKYIADSTSNLRCMRLASCKSITTKELIEVAKELPVLEELDISFCYQSKDSLEAIGQCCPLLKKLKLNLNAYKDMGIEGDEAAFAIARTMPELRYLQLLGNKLTNAGLLAILDGCLLLESLDLRACFNMNLQGSLGKRCAEQMKDLQLPDDYLPDVYDHVEILYNDPYEDLYCDGGLTESSEDEEAFTYRMAYDYYGIL